MEMDVFVIADFFGVDVEIDRFANEENVIHFVFAPCPTVTVAFDIGRTVMQPSQVLEIIDFQL